MTVTGDPFLRPTAGPCDDKPENHIKPLAELPAGTDLSERLGTPERYATDLRAAEGLEHRRGALAFLRARRPRNLALTMVALTLVGLAIGAVEWTDSYQPIALGNAFMEPQGVKHAPVGTNAYVVFHRGGPFRYGITIRNDGPFTVRVIGIGPVYGIPFSARLMMADPTTDSGMPAPSERFRPVDLEPGYTLALYAVGVYACPDGLPGGATTTWTNIPVRYSFLWRTATASLAVPDQLTFVFPKNATCPPTRKPRLSMR